MAGRAKAAVHAARESAEALALQGLAFLAEDAARMADFLRRTGLEVAELRAQVGTPGLSLAVLEHLAQDESLLLVFAAARAVPAQSVTQAIATLGGPPHEG